MDDAINRTASWLDGAALGDDAGTQDWALVEIFGHRRHVGRVSEIEKFGAKMLRIDVPKKPSAPLLGEREVFETFIYGGSAIFSIAPLTERAAREIIARDRAYEYAALPAPDDDEEPAF